MPAQLTISQVDLVRKTRRKGYLVISAVAYDGTGGIGAPVSLPAKRFERARGGDGTRWRPWRYSIPGDGVLLQSWAQAPEALGYIVIATATTTQEGALEVTTAFTAAASALAAEANDKAGTVAGAASALVNAIAALGNTPRIVGTVFGSEIDKEALREDWEESFRADKALITLRYDYDEPERSAADEDEDEDEAPEL